MGNSYLAHLVVMLSFLGMLLIPSSCQDDSNEYDATTAVYIVTLRQAPTSHNQEELTREIGHHFRHGASRRNTLKRTRHQNVSQIDRRPGSNIARVQDAWLKKVLKGEKYLKLYSYHYLINGFAVLITQQQISSQGITIAFVDTGMDPTHPSFADDKSKHPFTVPARFSGTCEVARDFPSGSCNRKLGGARHFVESAIARGVFNSTQDYASPFDGDGHGT